MIIKFILKTIYFLKLGHCYRVEKVYNRRSGTSVKIGVATLALVFTLVS